MATTILDQTTGLGGGFSDNSISGHAFRVVIAGAAFTGSSAGQLRFTLLSGNNIGLFVNHWSVALVGSATAPNTQLTPTEILTGGASGTSITGASPTAGTPSDWLTFAFNNSTDTMLIDLDISGATQGIQIANVGSNFNSWDKAAAADYNNATVSGYSNFASFDFGVLLIETQPVPGASAPVVNVDTYVPRAPSRSVSLLTSLAAGIGLLQPIASPPFKNYDWPVPRAATNLFYMEGYTANLVVIYPATLTFDYPNPRGPVGSIDLRTWTPANIAIKQQVVVLPATFGNFDWQVPKGAVGSVDLRTWTQSTDIAYLFAAPVVKSFDYPNPRAPASGAVDLKSWLQSLELVQASAAPVVKSFDYPNPRAPIGAIDLRSWVQDRALYASVVIIYPASFGQFDWPVPRSATGSIELKTWKQSLSLVQQLASPVVSSFDYPNPRAAIGSADLRSWVQNGALYSSIVIVYPASFGQFDWSVPRSAAGSIELKTWKQSLSQVQASASPVVSNFDYPNPRAATGSIALRSWVQAGAPYATVLVVYPASSQFDWPVPKGAAYSTDLRTWLQVTDIQFAAAAPVVSSFDYPNPRAPIGAIDLRSWVQDGALYAAPIVVYPASFGQFDWPVPRAIVTPTSLRTWVQSANIAASFAVPMRAQLDWPVPRASIGSIELKFWKQSASPAQFAALPVGSLKYDQPNPKAPVRSISLTTWLQNSPSNQFTHRIDRYHLAGVWQTRYVLTGTWQLSYPLNGKVMT